MNLLDDTIPSTLKSINSWATYLSYIKVLEMNSRHGLVFPELLYLAVSIIRDLSSNQDTATLSNNIHYCLPFHLKYSVSEYSTKNCFKGRERKTNMPERRHAFKVKQHHRPVESTFYSSVSLAENVIKDRTPIKRVWIKTIRSCEQMNEIDNYGSLKVMLRGKRGLLIYELQHSATKPKHTKEVHP